MTSYQLASIPVFQKRHKAIAHALESRKINWTNLIDKIEMLPIGDRASVLSKVAERIFLEGLLVVRFPNIAAERNRNAFKQWLAETSRSLLDESGRIAVVRGIEYSERVESLYRDAYEACCKLAEGYDPTSLVWASIRLSRQEYLEWRSQAMSAAKANPRGDRISEKLSTVPDGVQTTFTNVAFKIDVVLQRELRFLGAQNAWMEGTLKIPGHLKEAPLPVAKDRRNALAILDRVEDSDMRSSLCSDMNRSLSACCLVYSIRFGGVGPGPGSSSLRPGTPG